MVDARSKATPAWKPGKKVLRWAWITFAVLLTGGMGGPLIFVNPDLAIAVFAGAFLLYYPSVIKLWMEIGRDHGISSDTQTRLKQNLILMGSVPVLQLLIFTYLPDSGFSGLRGLSD